MAKGLEIEEVFAPSSLKGGDGGEDSSKGSHEACIDAMHRLLVAIEKKDPEAMHDALLLHDSICDEGGYDEDKEG